MATIRKKGEYQWHVQVRRKHITETKTFTTKADAEAWSRDVEGRIDRGVYISRVESENTTVADACERYQREVLPRLKGHATDASRLKTIKNKLGKLSIAAVNSTVLARFRDERLQTLSNQSVIHELGLITRVLKTCELDWGIALPSGVPLVRKPAAPPGRNRRVDKTEFEDIIKASGSIELKSVLRLALATAMRRSELAGLAWDMVNFKKPSIMLNDTKNGDSREIPLSKAAVALLNGLPRHIDGQVFKIRPDSITQAFERALTRARKVYEKDCLLSNTKIDKNYLIGIRFHDVRHEATSRIAEKVSNLVELASITGHKDLQMLKRYYHPKVEDLAVKLG